MRLEEPNKVALPQHRHLTGIFRSHGNFTRQPGLRLAEQETAWQGGSDVDDHEGSEQGRGAGRGQEQSNRGMSSPPPRKAAISPEDRGLSYLAQLI